MIVEPLTAEVDRFWMKAGTRYVVLEIHMTSGKEPHFRVELEDGTPGLVPASAVAITNGDMPGNWVVGLNYDPASITIGPQAWQTKGFWEAFFDHDPHARRTFDESRGPIAE